MNDRPWRNLADTAVLACLFSIALIRPSHAYVDPGMASVVITAILGTFAAIGYTARMYWARFKALFGAKKDAPRK